MKDSGFIPLAREYRRQWSSRPEEFLMMIGKYPSIRSVLVSVYYELVEDKKCERIEDLELAEKQALWQEALRIAPTYDKRELVEIVRALHGFGSFILVEEGSV